MNEDLEKKSKNILKQLKLSSENNHKRNKDKEKEEEDLKCKCHDCNICKKKEQSLLEE